MAAAARKSLTPSTLASEPHGNGFRAVGVAVGKLAAPLVAKRGGRHLGRLKVTWPEVAGPDWALSAWPAGLARDGALKLRVLPSAALELQHCAPLFIERVNLFLGASIVTRLVLKQAIPAAPVAAAQPQRPLTDDETAALDRILAQVADSQLRAALAGLGRAMFAATPAATGVAQGGETG
jgi:hypothetical protein